MAYTPHDWKNKGIDGAIPINATRLNEMETGIDEAHDAIEDTTTGHDHDGTDSKKVAAGSLTGLNAAVAVAPAVVANTAKETNVATDLSEGTSTETTVNINSSDGANATLLAANDLRAGLLTKAKFDEIVANTAKETNATHTGDVTGSGALTIANDAVTYNKMQNVAADDRILGNVSGAGNPVAELAKTDVLTMLNVEDGATADQTNTEIRAAIEAATDSNVFTDADHTKLNGIESGADVTGSDPVFDSVQAKMRSIATKTNDSNILSTDFGKTIRINSAIETTQTLPAVDAGDDGARITFIKLGAGKLIIGLAADDKFYDGSVGGTLYNDVDAEIGASILLEYVDAIKMWTIMSATGIWSVT